MELWKLNLPFSDYLSVVRAHCKITQRELSILLEVPESTINRWESGTQEPDKYKEKGIRCFLEEKLELQGESKDDRSKS